MSGYWVEAFNSDSQEFGGSGVTNGDHRFASQETPWNMRDNSVELRLPPLAGLMLRYDGPLPAKKKAATKPKSKAAKTTRTAKGAGKTAAEKAVKPTAAKGSSSRGTKRASSAKPNAKGAAPAKGKAPAGAAKPSQRGSKPSATGREKS